MCQKCETKGKKIKKLKAQNKALKIALELHKYGLWAKFWSPAATTAELQHIFIVIGVK